MSKTCNVRTITLEEKISYFLPKTLVTWIKRKLHENLHDPYLADAVKRYEEFKKFHGIRTDVGL